MAPWLIAIIFIAILVGGGWLADRRNRARRKGLSSLAGPSSRPDRIAEVERLAGGTTQHSAGGDTNYNGSTTGF
jgi:hypothetical protein